MGRILSHTYLSGFILLYLIICSFIAIAVILLYVLLYCCLCCMSDHNHTIIDCTRVLTPHALVALLISLGLLSDNPGLVCSRYLCLDHGAGTVPGGSVHLEKLAYLQEIIAFRLSSRRHPISLILSITVSSAWSLTSVRS